MNTCQSPPLSPWTSVAIVFTAVGALLFVVSYAWTTRGAWRSTAVGMNVMSFTASILVISLLGVVAIILGTDWPYRDAVRTGAWSLIGACIWWRVVILYRVQHRDDRGRN